MQTKQTSTRATTADILRALAFLVAIGYFFLTFLRTTDPVTNSSEFSNSVNNKEETTCTRNEPHQLVPEFERVLSLIFQRQKQNQYVYAQKFEQMRNCLDIRYTDLRNKMGAEGVFYFDSQVSTPNKIVIEVDSSYSITDDITTAYLLSHELTHARQYVETISGEKTWDCIDSEVEAFYEQLVFGARLLNDEESQSVISRLERGSQNNQLKQYEQLIDMSWEAILACGMGQAGSRTPSDTICWENGLTQRIRQMVIANPFYQEQCGKDF